MSEEALRYFTLGCAVVPFKVKEKRPLVEWQKWQTQRQTKEEFEGLPWQDADGFALVCGTKLNNGLFLGVLDFDVKNLQEETIEKGRELLKKFLTTQTEETPSGGQHWIYYCREKPKSVSAYHNECALELIGENKLVVMTPSQGYKRLNDNAPSEINDLTEIFEKNLMVSGLKVKEKDAFWFGREDIEEKYKGKKPPCIEKMFKGTEEGLRNEYGIRLASFLANFRKVKPKNVKNALAEWNQYNKPLLEEKELDVLLTSALRGNYVYGCSDPILWKNCDRDKCSIAPKNRAKFLKPEEKENASKILENPEILGLVTKFGRKRLIGEDNVLLTTFIEICSGQTKYPISGIIEGYSGSGKNESIRSLKPLIPPEWLFEFTTSTPEAVKYIPEEFNGTLIIYEASGMQSKTATLGLRAVGEGESIETIYPMRDEETGKMVLGRAKTNAKNFVTTESDVEVQADLHRRVLRLSMNHSIDLTKRVMAKKIRDAQFPESLQVLLKKKKEEAFEPKDFQNALLLNEWQREVIVFAPFDMLKLLDLAVKVEQKVALRTHIDKLLSFIRVLALLRQRQRTRIDFGETKLVIANPEDVFGAYEILGNTILSTITRLTKRQEEALAIFEVGNPLTKHEIADKLGTSEVTAARLLKALYKNGYLTEDAGDKKGDPYKYHLLKKPKQLVLLQNTSQYCLFFRKEAENLLNSTLSPFHSGVGEKIFRIENREACINEKYSGIPEHIEDIIEKKEGATQDRQGDKGASTPNLSLVGENKQNQLVFFERTSQKGLEFSQFKSLVRLTTFFDGVCERCGFKGKMDFQVNLLDDSWGLLCEKCGLELEKQLGRVD